MQKKLKPIKSLRNELIDGDLVYILAESRNPTSKFIEDRYTRATLMGFYLESASTANPAFSIEKGKDPVFFLDKENRVNYLDDLNRTHKKILTAIEYRVDK
ncbi:MAG: hypothetical protein ACP5OG_00445 [Candidatus Nanoarchaeia archaeon]